MLHANFMTLCFTKPQLPTIKVLHWGNGDFQLFLLLWPWPWPDAFIYKPDHYALETWHYIT